MKQNDTYKQGFKTPEDYFSSFEERFFEKLEEETVLENENGFTVPDGYFENVEQNILSKITTQHKETKDVKVIRLTVFQKMAIAVAASIVLFLGFQQVLKSPPSPSIASLDISTIESYIENNHVDLDSYDMMALLQKIPETNLEEPLQLSEEEIENYLLNTSDFTELIETQSL